MNRATSPEETLVTYRTALYLSAALLLTCPAYGQSSQQQQASQGFPVPVTPQQQQQLDNAAMRVENASLKLQLLQAQVDKAAAQIQAEVKAANEKLSQTINEVKSANKYGDDVYFDGGNTNKLLRAPAKPTITSPGIAPTPAASTPKTTPKK